MTTTRTARTTPWTWFRQGGWYFLLVLLSFGFLSPVPFAHAAARLRSRALWFATAGYTTAMVIVIVIAQNVPRDAANMPTPGTGDALTTVQVLLNLGVIVGALLHLRPVRRRAYRLADRGLDPAVAAALARRHRHEEARRLAARDAGLARDLHIGRPDLPQQYDDGGLVDLNHAPAYAIADACGIPMDIAEQLVATRVGGTGTLSSVDDVFAYVDVSAGSWDRVRDRGIVSGSVCRR